MSRSEVQSDSVEVVRFGTRVTVSNKYLTETMTLDRCNIWYGHLSVDPLPTEILPNSSVKILLGSKGAAQYSCPVSGGETAAWILAWDSRAHNTPVDHDQISVTCGEKSKMDELSWDLIEQIVKRGPQVDKYWDNKTQTCIDAFIVESVADYSILVSDFGFINWDARSKWVTRLTTTPSKLYALHISYMY
ncbi:hypothetical protein RND81_07G178400 [Saponaria officinalis]|uniref:Uncharacterized protein n=1 Tax=Saponaria officinalis TaxID=3572 RepID=A0AAW1JTV1_SAPOF